MKEYLYVSSLWRSAWGCEGRHRIVARDYWTPPGGWGTIQLSNIVAVALTIVCDVENEVNNPQSIFVVGYFPVLNEASVGWGVCEAILRLPSVSGSYLIIYPNLEKTDWKAEQRCLLLHSEQQHNHKVHYADDAVLWLGNLLLQSKCAKIMYSPLRSNWSMSGWRGSTSAQLSQLW